MWNPNEPNKHKWRQQQKLGKNPRHAPIQSVALVGRIPLMVLIILFVFSYCLDKKSLGWSSIGKNFNFNQSRNVALVKSNGFNQTFVGIDSNKSVSMLRWCFKTIVVASLADVKCVFLFLFWVFHSDNLMEYEGLMALTNILSMGNQTGPKERFVTLRGIPAVEYCQFSSHPQVRTAATECFVNVVYHINFIKYMLHNNGERFKLWISFAECFNELDEDGKPAR